MGSFARSTVGYDENSQRVQCGSCDRHRGSYYDVVVRPLSAVLASLANLSLAGIVGCLPLDRDEPARQRDGATARKAVQPGAKDEGVQIVQARSPRAPAEDPMLAAPFSDSFDRTTLGADWRSTSSAWQLRDGRLCVANAHNHPIWLKRRLPTNASIEFTATSASPDGDIKAEVWGDGYSAPKGSAYRDATSYLVVFGGWRNRYHVLARLDEHSRQRPEIRVQPGGPPNAQPVEPGRSYRFKVERSDGKAVKWYVDGIEILSYVDAAPLTGRGHDHFAFNDWATPVCFDDLKITPLDSHGLVRD